MSRAVSASLVALTLGACGGSQVPSVGSGETTMMTTPSPRVSDEGVLTDAPVVDVRVTELPPTWPVDLPTPPDWRIDNVIVTGDRTTVTWILPAGDPMKLTRAYAAALNAAGFESGESEADENLGRGAFSNQTHTMEFMFTPLTSQDFQAYVVYAPKAE